MGASLITVSRNDPDVVAVYNGGCMPWVLVETSKQDSYIVTQTTVDKSGLVLMVWMHF